MKKSMLKKLFSLLVAFALIMSCFSTVVFANTALQGSGTEESPYLIGTVDDLVAFREKVNSGETGAWAKLTANIALTEQWTPIGTYTTDTTDTDVAYTGTFDGAGFKITGFNIVGNYLGFFGYANGATVKNLTIEGVMTVAGNGAIHGGNNGAIVGEAVGTNIANCKFIGDVTGYAGIAGFIGDAALAAESKNTIQNCAFIGDLTAAAGNASGFAYKNTIVRNSYLIGDVTGGAEVAGVGLWANVENCFVYGKITATKTVASTFGLSNQKGNTNAYYVSGSLSGGAGIDCTPATEDEFASGKIADILGNAFGQTIGADKYPVFATADNAVIKTAIGTYTNNAAENGTTVPYTIKSYADLAAFRNAVNSKDTSAMSANVKLMVDIAIPAGTKWTPIGTYTWGKAVLNTEFGAVYTGTFDGNGHKISGVKIEENKYAGFFRQIDGATIKNLTVEGTSNTTDSYTGGFAGVARNAKIENCKFIGKVTGTNNAAGFIGSAATGTNRNKITHSIFEGNVEPTGGYAAGFADENTDIENSYLVGNVIGVGPVSGLGHFANVTNCFAYGDIIATTGNVFKLANGTTVENSYYLKAIAYKANVFGKGTKASDYDFASGKIAYELGDAFGQTIGVDKHPVFATESNKVIMNENDKYINEGGEPLEYVWEIRSYEDLAAFRDAVNSKDTGAMSANVKLMADIAIPEGTMWTPIGTWTWAVAPFLESDAVFTGVFDGNGHKITNVVVDTNINPERYRAFFRQTNGATIKNLTVEGNIGSLKADGTATGEGYTGGLIGAANNTTITNCKFKGNIYGVGNVAGFIGGTDKATAKNTILNCVFEGNVQNTNNAAYGFAFNNTDVINSYFVGNVTGLGATSGLGLRVNASNSFVYGVVTSTNAMVYPISANASTNCYYSMAVGTNGIGGSGTEATAVDFMDGKVAYMLNDEADEVIYGQTLPAEMHPTFFNNNMVYKSGDTYSNTEGAFIAVNDKNASAIATVGSFVIVAQYAKEGDVERLLGVVTDDVAANQLFKVNMNHLDGASLYKVFMWDSRTEMNPICDYAEYVIK